ncbi:MAG: GspE/PulE family protein [Oscillospiraceae bacterium]|nr:GspE/PulE family protein [Oscillospiraceae bacterium]
MRSGGQKLRLGDILINQNAITEAQLSAAFDFQKKNQGMRLGDCLIECGFITGEDIVNALSSQLNIDKIDLHGIKIPPEIIGLVTGSVLRKHSVLPVSFDPENPNVLILAMADPLDMVAQDDIAIITNCAIEPRITTYGAINSVLDRFFGTSEAMSAAEQYSKEREMQLAQLAAMETQGEADVSNAPIVQLVRSIIEQAVRLRTSDIHFDALEKQIRVRFRIDGVLIEKMMYDIALISAITTRIKILSGMDISEKRKPQDGRMSIIVDKQEYDIRVSILPSTYGEKVVMRLALRTSFTRKKSDLGMKDYELERFNQILANPHGIILVTGPTGSGKSTTLYTAISELNTEQVNIITVEDPVEANIAGVNQVQVNPKANMTFASALRSILRQDPDIIMVGEIRDSETAGIAVQASNTGHLVVSTLHTNSAAATITRLIDMGVESFLLADALVGIMAQRLVRRLCKACRVHRLAKDHEKISLNVPVEQELMIYDAGACHLCGDSGYYGRIGVYEIMAISPKLKTAISKMATTEEIRDIGIAEGMNTLRMSAIKHVLDGVTTVSEMLKISFENTGGQAQ